MKAPELFGVAVRTIGLISLLYLLSTSFILSGMTMSFGFFWRQVIWLAVSIYLLRGAPNLVQFAYPETSSRTL
ncbi:MAG: hypothetical protein ABIZ81_02885 [Opitutaceae bacterium]